MKANNRKIIRLHALKAVDNYLLKKIKKLRHVLNLFIKFDL